MDEELFKLCKEVYGRFPTWEDESGLYLYTIEGEDEIRTSPWFNTLTFSEGARKKFTKVPLYTSDYLLEKLPLGENINMFFYRSKNGTWLFQWTGRNVSGCGDTPLKALLKLVIALDDAGELHD